MATITNFKPQLTLEEFLALPETKPYSEYFNGKIEQKPSLKENIALFKHLYLLRLTK